LLYNRAPLRKAQALYTFDEAQFGIRFECDRRSTAELELCSKPHLFKDKEYEVPDDTTFKHNAAIDPGVGIFIDVGLWI
jgi:hypothetical protein